MTYPELPSLNRKISASHWIMLVAAGIFCAIWLAGSAYALSEWHLGLFARMGAIGLAAIVLFFWMRSSIRRQFVDQLTLNSMIAISTLSTMSMKFGSLPDEAKRSFEEQRYMLKSVNKSEAKDQIIELMLIVTATAQWGFGDCMFEASRCST